MNALPVGQHDRSIVQVDGAVIVGVTLKHGLAGRLLPVGQQNAGIVQVGLVVKIEVGGRSHAYFKTHVAHLNHAAVGSGNVAVDIVIDRFLMELRGGLNATETIENAAGRGSVGMLHLGIPADQFDGHVGGILIAVNPRHLSDAIGNSTLAGIVGLGGIIGVAVIPVGGERRGREIRIVTSPITGGHLSGAFIVAGNGIGPGGGSVGEQYRCRAVIPASTEDVAIGPGASVTTGTGVGVVNHDASHKEYLVLRIPGFNSRSLPAPASRDVSISSGGLTAKEAGDASAARVGGQVGTSAVACHKRTTAKCRCVSNDALTGVIAKVSDKILFRLRVGSKKASDGGGEDMTCQLVHKINTFQEKRCRPNKQNHESLNSGHNALFRRLAFCVRQNRQDGSRTDESWHSPPSLRRITAREPVFLSVARTSKWSLFSVFAHVKKIICRV